MSRRFDWYARPPRTSRIDENDFVASFDLNPPSPIRPISPGFPLDLHGEQVFDGWPGTWDRWRRPIMGTMRILGSTGDTLVDWDVDDEAAVRQAEELFAQLTRERKIPFARPAGATAAEAEQINTFDPSAEEIIWVRPIAGG
jgi:hypothetical protein